MVVNYICKVVCWVAVSLNENLILKAKELGYGTLIMGLRAGDKLREILSIPETETVMAVIAIGKAAEEPARPKRKDVEDIVRFY